MNNLQRVLIVDDEEAHLDILTKHLTDADYDVIAVKNGEEALQVLHNDDNIRVVLLDRMMPGMDGMDVFRVMKKEEDLKRTPVIFQTALGDDEHIEEGMKEGCFHYLTKPFDKGDVLPLVGNAIKATDVLINIKKDSKDARKEMEHLRKGMTRFFEGECRIRTTKGARHLAYILGNCFSQPRKTAIGLYELMSNAIEHGNLKLSAEQKYDLLLDGGYNEHINELVDLNSDDDEYSSVRFKREGGKISVTIEDRGDGFDYNAGGKFDASKATMPFGRGIYIASRAFDDLSYHGSGNIVSCTGEAALIH